jgi:hypothetical protein
LEPSLNSLRLLFIVFFVSMPFVIPSFFHSYLSPFRSPPFIYFLFHLEVPGSVTSAAGSDATRPLRAEQSHLAAAAG